jgi:tripartite-type tricarboxylate transporter receptor subunit TctC
MPARRLTIACASFAAALALVQPAAAAWPEKPVRVTVPFGPGGTTDILTRNVQKIVQDKSLLPHPLTVINVGGHFSVGSTQVKNAAPDGYTFLVIHSALLSGEVVAPQRNLSYRDFEPVALTGGFCLHPIVRKDSPYRTLKDLLDAAKANPGTITMGVNIGALNHMMGVFMEQGYPGAKFRFVQIGGGGENYAAITGGQTQSTVLSSSEYQSYKAGNIQALAYSGPRRLSLEPEIPTARELGLGFEYCIENYWFAPKGTPREAIDGMADMLAKAIRLPEMKEFFDRQAQTDQFMRGEEFRKRLDEEFKAIEPVARASMPR